MIKKHFSIKCNECGKEKDIDRDWSIPLDFFEFNVVGVHRGYFHLCYRCAEKSITLEKLKKWTAKDA